MNHERMPAALRLSEGLERDVQLCMWCDRPSIRLCDAVIGFGATGCERDKSGKVLQLLTGLDAGRWSCDAPMCEEHTKQVGWVCGEAADSIDRCPHHAQTEQHEMAALVMFYSEADSARRDIYAAVRRARMRAERSNDQT